jgi:hypothetical protein
MGLEGKVMMSMRRSGADLSCEALRCTQSHEFEAHMLALAIQSGRAAWSFDRLALAVSRGNAFTDPGLRQPLA